MALPDHWWNQEDWTVKLHWQLRDLGYTRDEAWRIVQAFWELSKVEVNNQ